MMTVLRSFPRSSLSPLSNPRYKSRRKKNWDERVTSSSEGKPTLLFWEKCKNARGRRWQFLKKAALDTKIIVAHPLFLELQHLKQELEEEEEEQEELFMGVLNIRGAKIDV